jgi:hypothetical protein
VDCKALRSKEKCKAGTRRKRRKAKNNEAPPTEWKLYTDHDPMEITYRVEKSWLGRKGKTGTGKPAEKTPDYARLRGSTTEATHLRKELEKEMDAKFTEMPLEIEWGHVVTTSHEVAMRVLGERETISQRPWLRGREKEQQENDDRVADAMQNRWDTKIRKEKGEGTLEELKEADAHLKWARKERLNALQRWEETWWRDLGEAATEAGNKGDQGKLFDA